MFAPSHVARALTAVLAISALGCSPEEDLPRSRRDVPVAEPAPAAPIAPVRGEGSRESVRRVTPAVQRDVLYDHADAVPAVRLLYRVSVRIPKVLGRLPESISVPATELSIVVTNDRLRARFEGPGWPVPSGSEVRLRDDLGGTYVFDAEGGRPLSPRFLAEWFSGGETPRVGLGIRPATEGGGPGTLVCTFLAEWAGKERDSLDRRCGPHGAPLQFRIGPWFGDRTAELQIDVSASDVRADEESPPDAIPAAGVRPILSERQLTRVAPSRSTTNPGPLVAAPATDVTGLIVTNRLASRVVVTANGAPLGWLDRGAEGEFATLSPGRFTVAAMTAFGALGWHPREVSAPGRVVMARSSRAGAD